MYGVGENEHRLEDAGIQPNMEEIWEALAKPPFLHWLSLTLGTTRKCSTTKSATLRPSRLRRACIGRLDRCTELSIWYQHLSEYLGKYIGLSWNYLQIYSSAMSEWKAQRAVMEKTRWKGCLEIGRFLCNSSRTSRTYLPMCRELELRFLESNLTGAGTGYKESAVSVRK